MMTKKRLEAMIKAYFPTEHRYAAREAIADIERDALYAGRVQGERAGRIMATIDRADDLEDAMIEGFREGRCDGRDEVLQVVARRYSYEVQAEIIDELVRADDERAEGVES